MIRHARLLGTGAAAIVGYGALIGWFAWSDFYAAHFFDRGAPVVFYNLSRVLFIGAIAWLIYAPGIGVLLLAGGGAAIRSLSPGERYALGFFTGAGVWHVALFGIGLAGGDTYVVAACLTLTVAALSAPHLLACITEAAETLPRVFCLSTEAGRRNAIGLAIFTAVAIMFVAVKGLYPGGGHDYYTHYFYYDIAVIKTGSIMPNEVWYHFYYSKGAGLYFLGMLLTDPLAPQLVGAAFIAAGALLVTLILDGVARGTVLPWVGATLYLAFLVFTPGQRDLTGPGGWGELEKIHEIAGATFFALIWISTHFAETDPDRRRLWLTGSAAAITATVLLTTVMAVLIEGFLGLLLIWGMATRQRALAVAAMYGGLGAGIVAIAVLAINYWATGIPLDQGIAYFWPIVDLDKVARWGVLSEVLWQHYGMSKLSHQEVPLFSYASLRLFYIYLRLDIWWPVGALGLAGLLWAIVSGHWRDRLRDPAYRATWLSALAFVGSFDVIAIGLGAGREQLVSFYRFSSLAYGPILCGVLLLCVTFPPRSRIWTALWSLFLAGIVISGVLGKHGKLLANGVAESTKDAMAFVSGRFSIREAYGHPGWQGRLPWGAVYPAMEQVWNIVGRGTPVYSLHLHSYCMLPDCHVVSWHNTRTIPDFDVVLFGTPEEAIAAIKRTGINYFFYSTELGGPNFGISSPIILSPIFAPDAISTYFGVKWSDGTSYLLTWRDQSEKPLDAAFLDIYRRQTEEAPIRTGFPLDDWRRVFAHFRDKGLHPYPLPWSTASRASD